MMSYNPGVGYHGDAYIMQAGQNILNGRNAALGALMDYGRDKAAEHNEREELAGVLDGIRRWGEQGAAEGAVMDANGQPMQPAADSAGTVEEGLDEAAKQGKEAKLLRNMMKHYAPNLGDTVEGMSTARLRGLVKGWAMGPHIDEAKARVQEHAARMSDYQAQAEERRRRAADDASVGTAAAEFGRYMSQPGVPGRNTDLTGEGNLEDGVEPPAVSQGIYRALQTPGLAGRAVPKLLESLAHYQDLAGDGGTVTEPGPYPGISIIRSKSGRGE